MKNVNRRHFLGGTAAAFIYPASVSARTIDRRGKQKIDAMADSAINYMTTYFPSTKEMVDMASGFLIMPLITQGGLVFGAALGDGVLRINGESADYYQSVQINVGLQVSAVQYSQALFFLNDNALNRFRYSSGWKFGAGMRYVVIEDTQSLSSDTLSRSVDVAAFNFGDSGLHVGVAVEGTKFTPLQSIG